MVARDTPNSSMISSRDRPSSTARTTRFLKSVEYALINLADYWAQCFGLLL
jgi:hypothetical protein